MSTPRAAVHRDLEQRLRDTEARLRTLSGVVIQQGAELEQLRARVAALEPPA